MVKLISVIDQSDLLSVSGVNPAVSNKFVKASGQIFTLTKATKFSFIAVKIFFHSRQNDSIVLLLWLAVGGRIKLVKARLENEHFRKYFRSYFTAGTLL